MDQDAADQGGAVNRDEQCQHCRHFLWVHGKTGPHMTRCACCEHEEWRLVPGHPRYEVSSLGRVRSNIRPGAPLILKHTPARGYPQVHLAGRGKANVHTIVALAFLGPRPEGLEVRHLDGNAGNPQLRNLAYGTRSENQRDAVAHGAHASTKKTHCPAGHEYSHIAHGQRCCQACLNDANRRFRLRKKQGVSA